MPSSPRFFARVQSFVASAKGVFAGFPRETAKLLARAQFAVDKKLEKLPPSSRKPVIIGTLAGFALLLFAFVGMSMQERDAYEVDVFDLREFHIPAWDVPAQRDLIPPEELFLPDEPDFVPGVMLGRERRYEWTAEDAEPWWQNPLADGEEQWRTQIERMVDEIMEGVP